MTRSTPRLLLPALAATLLALAGCGRQPSSPDTTVPPRKAPAATATQATVHFRDPGADSELKQDGATLQQAVATLLKTPDAGTLHAAQDAWTRLYKAYNSHYLLLAMRACAGHHDDVLARLDSWPLYPAYVDSLPKWPDSGIVNDPTLQLTAPVLRAQQDATDDNEVALGFQPLWLLLAGVKEAPRKPADLSATRNQNVARRRAYVRLATAQLNDDLSALGHAESASVGAMRCALSSLNQRLGRLAANQNATDPNNGLYVPPPSLTIIAQAQPATALAQLASDDNADLRTALFKAYPGFQAAYQKANQSGSWKPIADWIKPPPKAKAKAEAPATDTD